MHLLLDRRRRHAVQGSRRRERMRRLSSRTSICRRIRSCSCEICRRITTRTGSPGSFHDLKGSEKCEWCRGGKGLRLSSTKLKQVRSVRKRLRRECNLVMKGRASESRINDSDALFVVTSMYNDGTCFSIDTQGRKKKRLAQRRLSRTSPCTLGNDKH